MARPAKEARDRAQLAWPGATVVERRRNSIKHRHPADPQRFMLDVGIGPMHFGPSEDQEIDTAWQPGIAPWDFQRADSHINDHLWRESSRSIAVHLPGFKQHQHLREWCLMESGGQQSSQYP